jgi:hypothetical protein
VRLFGIRFYRRDFDTVDIIGLLFGLRRRWNLDFGFAIVNIVVNVKRFLIRLKRLIRDRLGLLGLVDWPVDWCPERFFRESARVKERALRGLCGILGRFLSRRRTAPRRVSGRRWSLATLRRPGALHRLRFGRCNSQPFCFGACMSLGSGRLTSLALPSRGGLGFDFHRTVEVRANLVGKDAGIASVHSAARRLLFEFAEQAAFFGASVPGWACCKQGDGQRLQVLGFIEIAEMITEVRFIARR